MEIIYKILNSDYINKYRQIRLECLKENPDFFGTIYEDEFELTLLKFDKALQENCLKNFLYGAFLNDNLVGICGFSQENRIKTNHRGEISQMFVKKILLGKGIGTTLLQLTIHKAFNENKIEMITLGVVDTNQNAISVYKKLGFEQFGFIDKYFRQVDNYWGFIFMALTVSKYRTLCNLKVLDNEKN